MGWERAGCLIAVVWLLRQPEDAITVQELADLYRSARWGRLPVASLPRSPAVAMDVLVAKDSNA